MLRRPAAALLCLALAAALGALPAAAEEELQTANGLTQPIYTAKVTEALRVPTSHGTLYGIVTRPVVPAGVAVPIILTYTPYAVSSRPVEGTDAHLADTLANYYVPRGYARAIFDLVGTRNSSGCYDYGGVRERESGAQLVDHLGELPWSNGRVAMIGASYDGTTAYAAAVEAPEHLTTIVPQVAIDRWYDYPYEGGVRRYSGYGTPLLFDFAYGALPPSDPRDPEHAAEVVAARVVPCDRVEHQVEGYGYDPVYDAYWDDRDYRARVANVTASVLVEGGWLDTNVQRDGSLRFFQALPEDHPKKLVMGQWGHATPGGTAFTDWNGVRHAWFDYWLLDYDGEDDEDDLPDTGVMDLPRIDTHAGRGERTQHDQFPPAGTQELVLPLVAQDPQAPGSLGLVGATDTTYTATDPTLTQSKMLSANCDDHCLVFRSAPVDRDVRISGQPMLDLAASSVPAAGPVTGGLSTQYTVVLFRETTSGARTGIVNGALNSRNRAGERTDTAVVSGQRYSGTVGITDTDYVVLEGERVGIAISSNLDGVYFPEDDVPTANTIVVGEGGSALRLPVSAGADAFDGEG